jgi:hypothetical protein
MLKISQNSKGSTFLNNKSFQILNEVCRIGNVVLIDTACSKMLYKPEHKTAPIIMRFPLSYWGTYRKQLKTFRKFYKNFHNISEGRWKTKNVTCN